MPSPHRPVDPRASFPKLEQSVLERWRERDVFAESVRRRSRRAGVGLLRGAADGQRAAGVAPRPGPRVQGHLPPLQDHVRLLRRAQGRVGLPRATGRAGGRGRARVRLQGRHRALRDRRVQRPLPPDGAQPRRGLEPADRADRLLDRSGPRLPDARPSVRRVGLVGAEDDPRQRAAVREAEGRPVLPARRYLALQPRARPARRLPGRARSLDLRPPPGHPAAGRGAVRRRAARLDDDAVDAGLQRGGRGRPRPHLRPREQRRPRADPRRGTAGAGARTRCVGAEQIPGPRAGGRRLRAAV